MQSGWQYFTVEELQCKGKDCCGGRMEMDIKFMRRISHLRRTVGFPFRVTSAYRCPEHNNNVSKSGLDGPHTTGRAMDIMMMGDRVFLLFDFLRRMGFTGIGLRQKGHDRFIHLDDLDATDKRPRPFVWTY